MAAYTINYFPWDDSLFVWRKFVPNNAQVLITIFGKAFINCLKQINGAAWNKVKNGASWVKWLGFAHNLICLPKCFPLRQLSSSCVQQKYMCIKLIFFIIFAFHGFDTHYTSCLLDFPILKHRIPIQNSSKPSQY